MEEKWERIKEWLVGNGYCGPWGQLTDKGHEMLIDRGVRRSSNMWGELFNSDDEIWVPNGRDGWRYVNMPGKEGYRRPCTESELEMLADVLGCDLGWATAAQLLDDEMDTL